MNNLITFENMKFGKLTVIEKDGEFYFMGKEVAGKVRVCQSNKAVFVHTLMKMTNLML